MPSITDNASVVRTLDVDESGDATITSACRLVGYHIFSEEAAGTDTHVKFYNKATAATASDTPVITLGMNGHTHINTMLPFPVLFSNGISVRAVTEEADNGNTGPTGAVSMSIFYLEI